MSIMSFQQGDKPYAEHMIMQCPALRNDRETLLREINILEHVFDKQVIGCDVEMYDIILGKCPNDIQPEMLLGMHRVFSINVYKMHCTVLKSREGIG